MHVSRYAYIQAKIQGMFARSWLGDRLRQLLRLKQLAEIYSLLFENPPPQVPERELIALLQKKIVERNIQTDIHVIASIPSPPDILIQLLRRYEFRAIKTILRKADGPDAPVEYTSPIGRNGHLESKGKTTVRALLAHTPYEWIIDDFERHEPVFVMENRLDTQYYHELWDGVERLPRDERSPMEDLVSYEILLQNIIWTLRLLIYFHKEREDVEPLLISVPNSGSFQEILSAFGFSKDNVQEWEGWKYAWLIREQLNEEFRGIDPSTAEFRAIRALYRKCRRTFHSHPFSVVPIYCFFRLKDFETDILQSVLEGVRISASEDEIIGLLGGM